MHKKFRFLIIVFFATIFLAAANIAESKRPQLLKVPLIYKTTEKEDMSIDLTGLSSVTVKVEKFTDKRQEPNKIGENREKDEPVPIVTDSDVGAFCSDIAAKELQAFGIKLGTEKPTHILSGDIVEFFVTETNTYGGSVGIRFTLKNSQGSVLWEGLMKGTSSRFGRSLKVDNYQESISDSLFYLFQQLGKEEKFWDALRK